MKRLYTVTYYGKHPTMNWTETYRDKVLAKNETECMEKFKKHHPETKGHITDWEEIDY